MGDHMQKCKRNVGISVMEVHEGGVRTRDTEATTPGTKRMKIDSSNTINHGYLVVSFSEKSPSPATSENSGNSNSDQVPLSPHCSSNECLRSVDLEAKGFETKNSTDMENEFSRETTPSSEICKDSTEKMESLGRKSKASYRRSPPAGKMPPPAEIEEFFSAAEKYEQKRFAEKYNYDIVKDVPLEGQYQWVRIKP